MRMDMGLKMRAVSTLAIGAALAFPHSAVAQDTPPPAPQDDVVTAQETVIDSTDDPNGQVFTPADFTQYAPNNAYDMVQQIPGFSIQGGNDNQRGLGQARQNILINGQRVSGKSNDAATSLRRIPAVAVTRIELVDGASLDIPGLSGQIVNVIATTSAFSGNFRWEPQFRESAGANWFEGEISLSGRIGSTDWNLGLSNDPFRDGSGGPEFIRDASGTLIETNNEFGRWYGDRPRLTGAISRTAANGNILNVNAAGEIFRFTRNIAGDVIYSGGGGADELQTGGEDEWNAELGGDYEFGLLGGRMKLIGLQRFEHSVFPNAFTRLDRAPGSIVTGNRFDRTVDEGESILRSEFSWQGGGDWQISAEGAYNTLESEAALFVRDAAGAEQPVILPGANAKVTEKRGESIVTYGRSLAPGLSAQFNLGGEYSNITVSGAGGRSRSFFRPKGSASLAWTVNPLLTVNAKLERRVDQLNFFDFLANVDVSQGTGRANNPELVPPQRWRVELEAAANLGEWGSIKPFMRIAWIEDIVDSIPVSPTAEALGNLDKATVYQPGVEGTILLDPLGWQGAKVDFYTQATFSELEDPLTGDIRNISGFQRYYYNVELRHDIPGSNWAWGGKVERNVERTVFRLDQLSLYRPTKPFGEVFVEHKDVFGLTVRGTMRNILDQGDRFSRTVFVDRRDGPVDFTEDRTRKFGLLWQLRVSGTI